MTPALCQKRTACALLLLMTASQAIGHGNVALEDDQCYMKLGFVEAHFTIFQPQISGHEEFCEDLPAASESVFVLEYEHGGPFSLLMDFRIIKDTGKLGRSASWAEVEQLENLERDTVFYSPPGVHPYEVFSVVYHFAESGDYIGIVTARHPQSGDIYPGVFAFAVGKTPWRYMLGVMAMLLALPSAWFIRRELLNRRQT